MTPTRPSIAYLTSGAGGMICGSCLHDNTLARALIRRGVDTHLIPTYTPIRTDEVDVSEQRVFLGGINVFLDQVVPGFRFLPRPLTRLLDQPWLIRWATRRASATNAASLGALTVSMLRGHGGAQRREMDELADWLATDLRPDLIVLTNILIAGFLPTLKKRLSSPVLVTLQGDDVFLDSLPEPFRAQSLAGIQQLVPCVDGFLVNSRWYGQYMARYLGLPADKIHQVPLGLDISEFLSAESSRASQARPDGQPYVIGYLARLSPEKGLHILVDAFIELNRRPGIGALQLKIAGWMGDHQRKFVEGLKDKLRQAKLDQRVQWIGEVTRAQKIEFLHSLDILSVPTVYLEPKGLYVLEALAAGVPVVQPDHGAFPELLAATGGGRLVKPHDPVELATALEQLLRDDDQRRLLGETGRRTVHERFNADAMAAGAWAVMERFLGARC